MFTHISFKLKFWNRFLNFENFISVEKITIQILLESVVYNPLRNFHSGIK